MYIYIYIYTDKHTMIVIGIGMSQESGLGLESSPSVAGHHMLVQSDQVSRQGVLLQDCLARTWTLPRRRLIPAACVDQMCSSFDADSQAAHVEDRRQGVFLLATEPHLVIVQPMRLDDTGSGLQLRGNVLNQDASRS